MSRSHGAGSSKSSLSRREAPTVTSVSACAGRRRVVSRFMTPGDRSKDARSNDARSNNDLRRRH